MTDDPVAKPRRGRPRVHATPEEARIAAIARATAHTRQRRQALVERTVALTPATVAKVEALIAARGLDGLTALVEALVAEETARLTTLGKSVDGSAGPP